MPPVELHGLHALTHPIRHGGIPIGIAFDHHGNLTRDTRRRLAAQTGLPKTLFVSPSVVVDFQLDCWSATQQISASPTDIVGVMGLLQEIKMLPRRYVAFDSTLGIITATIISGMPVIEQQPATIQVTRPLTAVKAQFCAKLAAIDPSLFQSANIADAAIVDGFLMLPISDPFEIEAKKDRDHVIREILVAEGIEGLVGVSMSDGLSSASCTATLLVSRSLEMIDPLHLGGALARYSGAIERQAPTSLTIRQHAQRHSQICHAVVHAPSDPLATESLLIGGTCQIGPICHFSLSDSAA